MKLKKVLIIVSVILALSLALVLLMDVTVSLVLVRDLWHKAESWFSAIIALYFVCFALLVAFAALTIVFYIMRPKKLLSILFISCLMGSAFLCVIFFAVVLGLAEGEAGASFFEAVLAAPVVFIPVMWFCIKDKQEHGLHTSQSLIFTPQPDSKPHDKLQIKLNDLTRLKNEGVITEEDFKEQLLRELES